MNRFFDDSVNTVRFSIKPVTETVFTDTKYSIIRAKLEEYFDPQVSKKILQAILRFSFYIEPVKQPKIETTKFDVRWSNNLDRDDRYCTFDECVEIFEILLTELLSKIKIEKNRGLLKIIVDHSLVS